MALITVSVARRGSSATAIAEREDVVIWIAPMADMTSVNAVSRSCTSTAAPGKGVGHCWAAVHVSVGWSVTATWTIRRRSCAG